MSLKTNTKKKVLVLGAGLVTRPAVRYLSEVGFALVVASRTVSKAEALIDGLADATCLPFTIDRKDTLVDLVSKSDLVISLLPAAHHVEVAEVCLAEKTPLVTTSYVSPAMRALDSRARDEGVVLLNEVGLDPGIDHMSAMKVIHQVEAQGGKVTGFKSYCGGLPAAEANTNPWGYKFSWSPRGVVLAGTNAARYLEDGRQVDIPGPELFAHHWPVEVPGSGVFEAYPNRDSLGYLDLYGLNDARTMFRGTLRYPGWCETWKKMVDLGLLDLTERDDLASFTYRQLLAGLVPGASPSTLEQDLERHLGIVPESEAMKRWKWLGLLSEEPVPNEPTLLDVVSHRLLEKLTYEPSERDLIVLHHEFEAEYPDRRQKITSTLVEHGVPGGDSAMARTVSLPAAIGTRLILEGRISAAGVWIPVAPQFYEPILEELGQTGIVCREVFEPPLA